MMKKILTTLVFALAGAVAFAAGGDAATILKQVRVRMAASPSVEATFTINGGDGPVQGNASMAADKYFMTTPVLTVWYDGRTQWTFLKSSGEVSITEPTADELMESNPFAILSSPSDRYTLRMLGDSQGRKRVEMTPKSGLSGISKIVLFVDPTTHYPAAIVVNFDDGRAVDVVIDNITAAKAKPVSAFRYDSKRFPASEIIDLR